LHPRHHASRPLAKGLSLALALAPACRCGSPEDEAPTPEQEPEAAVLEDVEWAGCHSVWLEADPVCVFDPGRPLRLWLTRPDPAAATIAIDGQPWPAEIYLVEGMEGFGLELEPPVGARQLAVELTEPRMRWSLSLRASSDGAAPAGVPTSHDVDDALGRAYEAGLAGDHREALRLLAAVEDLAARYPEGRADLETYRGVLRWWQGRYHEAAMSLRRGVAFAIELRDAELAGEALHVYAGILAELGYTDAAAHWASEVLAAARSEPEQAPCVVVAKHLSTVGYIELLLARQRGSAPVDAPPLLEQALARVGPEGTCPDPPSVPAILLSLADAALDRRDPTAALAALARVDYGSVPTSDERLRLCDAELRALASAGRPFAELSEPLARLDEAVATAGTTEGRWRLASRRGDVLVLRGQREAAVAAYRQAEAEAQRLAELAAVGVGRDAAVTSHGESTERLVELLVELGRPDDALCVAREAQARRIQAVGRRPATPEQGDALDRAIDDYETARRALDSAMSQARWLPRKELEQLRLDVARSEERRAEIANEILHAQSTWQPSCEQLVPRATEELLLGLYPAREGWRILVQGDEGTHTRWLAGGPEHALDDPELGAELLAPFHEDLQTARRVRVLASGRAQAVDVHLLSWNGAMLIEQRAVAYGAELPRRTTSAPAHADRHVALLVADPTRTLRSVPEEVGAATAWMTAHGWTLNAPSPEHADRERVLEGLERASFFYFSGHGEHDVGAARARALPPYAGGTRDWPARLRLTPPTVLEVQDVLMLPSAPRHVALLGCETGVPGSGGGGMSLALAFLVAGAEAVVATPVAVADAVGSTTGLELLEEVSGSGVDLVTGLQRAQASMLRRSEAVGRYRVWVR
jgi:tetratricopeptide (TPR) repeat protein